MILMMKDLTFTSQVSHHPPTVAQYCDGRDWRCWQEFTMASNFRGKYQSFRWVWHILNLVLVSVHVDRMFSVKFRLVNDPGKFACNKAEYKL
jgi:hypothetical protein